jgi:hypothetical protein
MNRGEQELQFDVKGLKFGVVLKLRHGGAPPATVPENLSTSEKKAPWALSLQRWHKWISIVCNNAC